MNVNNSFLGADAKDRGEHFKQSFRSFKSFVSLLKQPIVLL